MPASDDSEDVSVLVDRVIHDAHKQVTVEARASGRLSQGHQDMSGGWTGRVLGEVWEREGEEREVEEREGGRGKEGEGDK